MTRAEILADLYRVKRTIRFLVRNKGSIIRRGGIESYETQLDFALKEVKRLKNLLEELT